MDEPRVRILTLNCWGLLLVSRRRRERIEAIAARLAAEASGSYDIVALQELWVESDFELVRHALAPALPYAKRWYSGMLAGPGLVVFSRWPILSAYICRFALNGRPSAVYRGDWFVGKSAGSCVIQHPCGPKLEVINAHLHAPYQPVYDCHRVAQAWEVASMVSRAISSGHTVFVTGDLNYRPKSIGLELLDRWAGLSDAWVSTHASTLSSPTPSSPTPSSPTPSSPTPSSPTPSCPEPLRSLERTLSAQGQLMQQNIGLLTPQAQIELAGVTSDSRLNTWRTNYHPADAQRLDYVFFDARTAQALTCEVTFTEPVPNVGSCSDHFGVVATFALSTEEQHTAPRTEKQRHGFAEKHGLAAEQMLHDVLHTISAYKPIAQRNARLRYAHFWLTNAALAGMLVSVWWGAAADRAYVGFIYLLSGVVLAVTGYVNGLIGFLFGRNEERALTEFESQVRLVLGA